MRKSWPRFFGAIALSAVIAALPARAQDDAEHDVIQTGNTFGLSIFDTLIEAEPDTTVVISPYSVAVALTMTAQGAAGDTAEALDALLAPGDTTLADAATAHRAAADRLRSQTGDITLAIANAVWGSDRLPWRESFLTNLRTRFAADIMAVDFADPATVGQINDWVAEQTEGMIPSLVDSLPEGTGMVLTNAVYFRGLWQTPFEASETTPQPFTLADGSTRDVPMMRRVDQGYRYAETDALQAVSLPYGDGMVELLVLVPRTEADASPQALADAISDLRLRTRPGTVELPRLDLDFNASLKPVLSGLGLDSLFSAETADFSGMADVAPGVLVIDDVLHKTALQLDEEGTEAAAVTGVIVGVTSATPIVAPFSLVADRPFVFAIRDRGTGALLFLGYVADPGT